MYAHFLKPVMDMMLGLLLLIILIVPLLVFTLLLYQANKGTPFFKQARPGKNGKIFNVIKFKTMNDRKDASGVLLSDEIRLTPIGKFFRKSSLDELPQLFNVIKGDLSLIGPRPLLIEYLPIYNETQKRRHEVKPGITGWAQVNGRNAISWQKKFELDVWYVDNMSFALDMKILWLTVLKVFKSEGINQLGQATVEKFNGHN